MARIPISISKIFKDRNPYRRNKLVVKREVESDAILYESFLIEIEEKTKNWNLSLNTSRSDLIQFRDKLNEVLGFSEISKQFNCSIHEAEKIFSYQESEAICKSCNQKNKICFDCIYTCQSPLEQKLFVALKSEGIDSELQRRIRKDGTGYSKNIPIDKKTILTLPDFYIETFEKKICIYADGHTYHERTEYQALRDRNIDRELQNFGYVCLRFTGKEIRENIEKVIETIKVSMDFGKVRIK